MSFRFRQPQQATNGWQHIHQTCRLAGNFLSSDCSGPIENTWHANPTLGEVALQSLEWAVAVEDFGLVSTFFVRTIVGTEEGDGVVVGGGDLSLAAEGADEMLSSPVGGMTCLFFVVDAVALLLLLVFQN